MASLIVPRRCLKCTQKTEAVSCEGCKKKFCTQHLTEHRKILSTELHQQLLSHKDIFNHLLGKQKRKEFLTKDILSQINQWENDMIERIRYRAELTRERLNHLTATNYKTIIKDAQELGKEIAMKDENNDSLENDIERLKESIARVRLEQREFTGPSNVELYIEPNHMIDWNHLIYVREKSVHTISTLVKSQQRTHSDSESSSSSSSSDEKSDPEEMNSGNDSYPFERPLSNEDIGNSVQTKPLPAVIEKQVTSVISSNTLPLPDVKPVTRSPLAIVETAISSPTIDISRPSLAFKSTSETTSASSSVTEKTQQRRDLARQMFELLRGNNST